jgi:tellurite resistance protein TehA-like permease
MSYFNLGSLFFGLIIPFVGVIVGVALLSQSEMLLFSIPIIYFWIFLWFVLTSVCLAISWFCFDRADYEDEEQ